MMRVSSWTFCTGGLASSLAITGMSSASGMCLGLAWVLAGAPVAVGQWWGNLRPGSGGLLILLLGREGLIASRPVSVLHPMLLQIQGTILPPFPNPFFSAAHTTKHKHGKDKTKQAMRKLRQGGEPSTFHAPTFFFNAPIAHMSYTLKHKQGEGKTKQNK